MKVLELYADLTLNTGEFNAGLQAAGQAGQSFQGNMTAIAAKAVAMGQALYDAGKQAAKMAVDLGKDIIAEYADTEQLLGGVDTIFKQDAQTVIENAARAYQTAGMSAFGPSHGARPRAGLRSVNASIDCRSSGKPDLQ